MKFYLEKIFKLYNEKFKNNQNIKDDYNIIQEQNLNNLKKLNDDSIFILNIYIYNLNNNFSKKNLENFKNEEEEKKITFHIFLNYDDEDKFEDFLREFNLSIKNHLFKNFITFLTFINFKSFPENLLEKEELIYNNIFLIKT